MPTYDGVIRDKGGAVYNVTHPDFGADPTGVADSTVAIQNAWDAAKVKGGRVYLPEGTYKISLRGSSGTGYSPALVLSGNGSDKEKQPSLEGAGRGVTFAIAFPADASRTLEVIRIDKGTLTDNPRGIELSNFRLVNTSAPADDVDGVDYRGVGIKITQFWTGRVLDNFQVNGFYAGVWYYNGYHGTISHGEIRNCNFALYLRGDANGVPNGNNFHALVLRSIRPVLTVEAEITAEEFPPDASLSLGYRVGACVYIAGGSVNALHFDSVHTEVCSTVGYFIGGGTLSGAVISNMRSESVYAPVWAYGPLAPYYTVGVTFLNPSIDCDSLIAPGIYLHRASGFVIVSPRFYQRVAAGSQTAIEMTSGSLGNLVINPLDGDRGLYGNLDGAIVDHGTDNRVEWLSAFEQTSVSPDVRTPVHNSDGNVIALPLMIRDGVTAGTSVVMGIAGAGQRYGIPPYRAGSVLGIAVHASAAPAADVLTFSVTRNGANWSGGPSVTLPVGAASARAVFGKGQHDFAETDIIGLKVTAGSGFGSQTVNVEGVVFVEI
ncbi:MAG: glycosyl hydrolase family 28-related protein [Longimicrobiaceae bacterium]